MPKKNKDYFMNITTQTGTSRPALLSLAGGLSFFIVFIFGTLLALIPKREVLYECAK